MVGREGFEPSTNWLKASCSTPELTAPRSRNQLYGFKSVRQALLLLFLLLPTLYSATGLLGSILSNRGCNNNTLF